MKHENGSPMKLAGNMIFKWVICLLVSVAILVPCVLVYNNATRPPEGEVFSGSAMGMFCTIEARVTVADGQIVDVQLTGADETPSLGGVVLEEMPAKILEAQSANVDGMAGATVTSDAVRQAVSAALMEAGMEEAAALPAGEVYTASAQGFGGEVVAEITVDGGKIVDVKLTGENETPGLGGAAIEEMPAKILEAQSAAVDGRTGATVTSTAIKAAVTDALTQAGMISEQTYVGTAQGANGEVKAELTVVNGEVADMKLTGDVVSQSAVQAAINDALTQAGLAVEEVTPEPAPADEPAGDVYTASAKGFAGNVTVEITVDGGKIADVKLSHENETPGFGATAIEELPARILEAQSAEFDGWTGATFTTTAVREALADAMAQAGIGGEAAPADEPTGDVYTASAKGFAGNVTVEITVDGGKIADVKLSHENETPGFGATAIEELPARILEAQSAEFDGWTGATFTTTAVREALADAMAQAGIGAAAEEPAPAEPVPAVPTASRENGVITADEWQEMYPEIVASYKANGENTYILDYLEADPYLVSLYEGYGFAKMYGSARGHEYCLEDLGDTARPHPLANCLTCKTADFTKLVNDLGVEAYSMDFETVYADMSENVGCYTCHGNEAAEDGKLVVTHDYIIDKLGDNMSSINASTLSCGQCHIEYYFEPDTKATSVPYTSVAEMDPAAILEYYDSIGFSDWTQPSTGAKMLKAQHPEMETYLNGSIHSKMGMSCASCHMEKQDGYTSHELVSPLDSEIILTTCATCHSGVDMAEKVHAIQAEVTARETKVGNALAALKDKLAEAVASGEYTEEELDAIRVIYRQAQWFFDFDYVENAEGAHNSQLAHSCLDKAEALIAEGNQLFKDAPEVTWVALADAADGTYSAAAKGFGGNIAVDVTLSGGKIVDVKIVGDQETPGLGAVAVEKMPQQLLNAQAMDVDGIAGATVSSTAIRKAFGEALAQANVDASKLENMTSQVEIEKTEEELDVDVVIVGAGGAGMSAAITAKQAGKNVILLEKMPYVGGNTTKASGGMNAAGTSKQAEAIAAATDEKVKASLEDSTVENFIIDTMAGGHELNDPALVRTMAEKSADAIDWLDEIGAPLPEIAATGGTVHMYLHEPEDGSAVGEYLVKVFSGILEKMGIPVYLDTAATELLSENGRVVGVKAESVAKDYTIHAKAVILATGGFGANEEMYCTYRPDLKGTVTTNAPGATGDGIVMAQALGAALVDIEQIQLHPTVFQDNGFLVSERLRSNGAILVNKNGQRFTNDLSTRDAVSAAELEQPDCCAFIVYDSQYADQTLYKKYVTNGLTVQGETLEELAAAMGFDAEAAANFAETVAQWNDTVKNETPDPFGRNNGLVALESAPYYAIKIAPGIHHTMGGVKIDTETHVINTSGEIIPGLFAAGEVTGGVHGGNRIGGNAVADIVVFGRIAGGNACAFADEQ